MLADRELLKEERESVIMWIFYIPSFTNLSMSLLFQVVNEMKVGKNTIR